MQTLLKYFPNLSEQQKIQFEAIERLYPEWNSKINVISRKDIENLEVNHILHSLGITKFIKFTDGTKILDFGTGGGLPGIPLAIFFPNVKFHLVDRIGKKIKVAQSIAESIGLQNVTFQHGDVNEVKGQFDFVVSRAVMDLKQMLPLVRKFIAKKPQNAVPNGIICLKGGDLKGELAPFKNDVMTIDLKTYFDEPFFDTKKVIYLVVK